MPDWLSYDNLMRGLSPALLIINQTSNELLLPEIVVKTAVNIYRICLDKKLTTGRKREPLVGACIFISCQGVNYPIDLTRLCKALEIERKDLIRQKKYIKRYVETNEEGITTQQYIYRYGRELNLDEREITQVINLSKKFEDSLINKKSEVIASALIHLVSNKSIRRVTRVSKISNNTLCNTLKEIRSIEPNIELLLINKPVILLKAKKK